MASAVFGGGCFWCTEAIFLSLKGVSAVMPGYAGGDTPNPTYEQVCTGSTGHAEAIKIDYDPAFVAYKDLLEVFFSTHDPTTLNRQGNDVGTQYRSIVLTTSDEQRKEAEAFIEQLKKDEIFPDPIVTEIKPLDTFYPAEDYHRNYYANNKDKPYCQVVINPKLAKFKKKFAALLKTE